MARRPPTIASLSYALRAATHVLEHLARDGRVLEWWTGYCFTRGLTPDALKSWREHVTSGGDRTALDDALDADREAELAALTALCRDDLGLDYVWLPSVLLNRFRLWVDESVTGHERRIRYELSDEWLALVPKGRQHDTCERDVEWWYRVRVKHPPDRPEDIGREASPAAREGQGRSTIANKAVARVEAALATLTNEETAVLH